MHAVPGGGKLVDIGTAVHTLITASDKFKDITCVEYTEINRKELSEDGECIIHKSCLISASSFLSFCTVLHRSWSLVPELLFLLALHN